MLCPFCDSEKLKVIDSRDAPKNTIRRRRLCLKCGKRFSSYEYIDGLPLNLQDNSDGNTKKQAKQHRTRIRS